MLKMSRNGVKSMLKVSVEKMFDKRYSLFGVSIIFCKVFFFLHESCAFWRDRENNFETTCV